MSLVFTDREREKFDARLDGLFYRRSRASASGLDPEGEARHHA